MTVLCIKGGLNQMNDHQDSESFTYERTWEQIHTMLDRAEKKQNQHFVKMQHGKKSERVWHMRNYKALEGVVKALRWTLGDKKVDHPLE
tara:strand:- start:210 stop:476 length:267 start_codon:yes stop_codon:yes gene_type:complete